MVPISGPGGSQILQLRPWPDWGGLGWWALRCLSLGSQHFASLKSITVPYGSIMDQSVYFFNNCFYSLMYQAGQPPCRIHCGSLMFFGAPCWLSGKQSPYAQPLTRVIWVLNNEQRVRPDPIAGILGASRCLGMPGGFYAQKVLDVNPPGNVRQLELTGGIV